MRIILSVTAAPRENRNHAARVVEESVVTPAACASLATSIRRGSLRRAARSRKLNRASRAASARSPPTPRRGRGRHLQGAERHPGRQFALYLKTKNFHWHVSGPHFRDYHLLLDEQAAEIFATTDELPSGSARSAARRCARSAHLARRSRSRTTTRSSFPRANAPRADDRQQVRPAAHAQGTQARRRPRGCRHREHAEMIDPAEKRVWFLFEAAARRTRAATEGCVVCER